jgi:hypothetical protein
MSFPVDFDYVASHHISSYRYVITRVVPFTSADIVIILQSDSDSAFNKSIDMTIEGEEYSLWGNDDNYITDLVAKKVASLHPA